LIETLINFFDQLQILATVCLLRYKFVYMGEQKVLVNRKRFYFK